MVLKTKELTTYKDAFSQLADGLLEDQKFKVGTGCVLE